MLLPSGVPTFFGYNSVMLKTKPLILLIVFIDVFETLMTETLPEDVVTESQI